MTMIKFSKSASVDFGHRAYFNSQLATHKREINREQFIFSLCQEKCALQIPRETTNNSIMTFSKTIYPTERLRKWVHNNDKGSGLSCQAIHHHLYHRDMLCNGSCKILTSETKALEGND